MSKVFDFEKIRTIILSYPIKRGKKTKSQNNIGWSLIKLDFGL